MLYIKGFIAAVLLGACCLYACKEIPDGFLSSQMYYSKYPFEVSAGSFTTYLLNSDGSSSPLTVTIEDVRDVATGKSTAVLTTPVTTYVWNQEFDPVTDTTLALINGKRKQDIVAPMYVAEQGGTLIFTTATSKVPEGMYEVDLRVKNSRGEQVYKKAATFKIVQPQTFRNDNSPYYLGVRQGAESISWNPIQTETSTVPVLSITKLADSPNVVIFKMRDKNGKLLQPKVQYGDRPDGAGGSLQNLNWYAYHTTITDTAFIYDYALIPFPYKSRGNSFCNYYRIFADGIVSIDSANTQAKMKYHVNMRFCGQLLREGKYEFRVNLDRVVVK